MEYRLSNNHSKYFIGIGNNIVITIQSQFDIHNIFSTYQQIHQKQKRECSRSQMTGEENTQPQFRY